MTDYPVYQPNDQQPGAPMYQGQPQMYQQQPQPMYQGQPQMYQGQPQMYQQQPQPMYPDPSQQMYQQPQQTYVQPPVSQPVNYQQHEVKSQAPNMQYADQKYDYNTSNIQYTNMTVDQWQSVPVDPSPYSMYWDSPQAFQPENIRSNMEEKKQYHDKCWAFAFWIQFTITACICVWLVWAGKNKFDSREKEASDGTVVLETSIDWGFLGKVLGMGFIVALALNLIHGMYASYFPVVYIKLGFWVGLIISVIFGVVAILTSSILWVIFPILSLLITLCYYCSIRRYIKFSAAVFAQSMAIIRRHPTILLFTMGQMLVDSIVSVVFSFMVFMTVELNYSGVIYFWIVFSFLWTNLTFGYVAYMTGAGLAASWYFLDGTEYYPEHPVWDSFVRAMTTSFGAASVAGFILAVIRFIRYIIEILDENNDNVFICIILCMVRCILSCVEIMVSYMNKYGLIYCAVFGVPYSEGCRRYQELSCKKFCDLIMRGSCISTAITYNMFIFTVCAALLGYVAGYMMFKDDIIGKAYTCGIACMFAFTMFEILSEPLDVIPDTILVCFAENPERLKTTASELAETITELYGKSVSSVVNKS